MEGGGGGQMTQTEDVVIVAVREYEDVGVLVVRIDG